MVELICDKCSAKIPVSAKFCPNCGDPVTDADRVSSVRRHNHVPQIRITFGYSTSRSYDTAVEICSRVPSFTTDGEDRDAEHRLTLDATDVELAVRIWDLVGGWKSASMTIDGEQISKKDLVYNGLGCFQKQQTSPRPQQYCYGLREYEFNVFGCHRLGMPLVQWADWLQYGKFDDRGVWHFDKARIKRELEIKLNENRFCPLLSKNQVLQTLDKIPDSLNPKTDSNWEYVTRREYGNDYRSFKDVAVGIRPIRERAVNTYVVREQKPDIPPEEDARQASELVTIDMTSGSSDRRTTPSKSTSSGCLTSFLMILGLPFLLILIIG